MNQSVLISTRTNRPAHIVVKLAALAALAIGLQSSACQGVNVVSFAEPYRSIDVAAVEPGIIRSCEVREGDMVAEGEVLAKLDHDVQLAMLAMGEKSKDFRGRIISAQAEVELRRSRLVKLEELHLRGHARQEEVERARADVAIAEGNLMSAREDLMLKHLEFQRMQAQIERRIIRSPLAGVVTTIRREKGEYVPAADPHVMTVVQLDSLLATFAVPAVAARTLQAEQQVEIFFPLDKQTAVGVIEFISPVDDAESNTVRVKVRIDNRAGQLRSGQRCILQVGGPEVDATSSVLQRLPQIGPTLQDLPRASSTDYQRRAR